MGGVSRRDSPTGVPPSPKSTKVCFVDGEVTSMSRPPTNDEHWTLYYFETHAAICGSCRNPKAGKKLCDKGRGLAIDVARQIYRNDDGKICSRRMQGNQEVRVEVPTGYDQTFSLLKAIQRAVRKGEHFLKPKSHDSKYYVSDRRTPEPAQRYQTRIVEPRSQPKDSRARRDDPLKSLAESKRGSYYDADMGELEEMERWERRFRYNCEVRGPQLSRRLSPYR